VFTHDTVPLTLLSAHETKGGAWAMIHVLEGKLRYCLDTPASESILELGQLGVIEPQVRHHVELIGPVRFYLEFYRAP
jgi:tellurite methyltransferase